MSGGIRVKSISEVFRDSRLEGEQQCVGGVRGGSCWDSADSHQEEFNCEHTPIEIECLEDILTELCPAITFLQYKKLERCMNTHILETTENEYYGNSSNFQQMVITMGDLYDALIKIGVISE